MENTAAEPDLIELAIAALSDRDLDLLYEHTSLREAGFDEEQTATMMDKRYQKAQKAAERFQKRYKEAVDKGGCAL